MPLIELRAVELSFGGPALLDGVSFGIDRGERVALIGRNGAGKSTLLMALSGELVPEAGEIRHDRSLRVARLEQNIPHAVCESVYEAVVGGLPRLAELLKRYHDLVNSTDADQQLDRIATVQTELEAGEGWRMHQRVEATLSRLSLSAEARVNDLSGGLRRRVLLARALVSEPELLLLDEPTNHLDIESIQTLEASLAEHPAALCFVTHDRAFLRRLATRVVELDRGRLLDFPGNYERFIDQRDQALAAEDRANAEFDKKLAAEERWIRQGIKARRTRNEGRVRALQQLRRERAQRREREGEARFSIETAERSGRRVFECTELGFAYPDAQPLIRDLDCLITRGDKVGLIGPNGVGKSTLLKLLLGELEPSAGRIHRGVNLEPAYFDQTRSQLNPQQRVVDAVAEGRDFIDLAAGRRHVMSYLQDFLFSPDRARQPVGSLSGGECNRLLLARLFANPANLLILDEPTNDLDVETLELLEELLSEFPGTVLLVSHDRDFLDNVVTQSLVFEGAGQVRAYIGGYSDWMRQREATSTVVELKPKGSRTKSTERAQSNRKLGYQESRELAGLPVRIEKLELRLAELHARFSESAFYQQDTETISMAQQEAKQLEAELETLFTRWEELETI